MLRRTLQYRSIAPVSAVALPLVARGAGTVFDGFRIAAVSRITPTREQRIGRPGGDDQSDFSATAVLGSPVATMVAVRGSNP